MIVVLYTHFINNGFKLLLIRFSYFNKVILVLPKFLLYLCIHINTGKYITIMKTTKQNKPTQKDLTVYPVRLQPEIAGKLKKYADRKEWSMHQVMVKILETFAKKIS